MLQATCLRAATVQPTPPGARRERRVHLGPAQKRCGCRLDEWRTPIRHKRPRLITIHNYVPTRLARNAGPRDCYPLLHVHKGRT